MKKHDFDIFNGRPSKEFTTRIQENGMFCIGPITAEKIAKYEYKLDDLIALAEQVGKLYETGRKELERESAHINEMPWKDAPETMRWISLPLGTYTLKDALKVSPQPRFHTTIIVEKLYEAITHRLGLYALQGYASARVSQEWINSKRERFCTMFSAAREQMRIKAETYQKETTVQS